MKEFFKEIFEYNYQINQKILAVMATNASSCSEKSISIMNHILNAHQIWNNRILSKPDAVKVWEIRMLSELKDIDQNNYQTSLELIESRQLDEEIHYKKSTGELFKNNVRDLLFHISNHSTYHRGQIASEFRNSGLEPIISDFIIFKR